ncbi:MAG TPA: hypothetical protein VG844_06845 [Terracidiphilus sp.]|nr:hypothetical protein [Terracidiphilus sp.]
MTFGLSLAAFTLVHVVLSLIGIGTGFIAIFGLFSGRVLRGWTGLFLWTTVLTSVTGFLFPFHGVTPGIVLGVLSMIVLLPALFLVYGGSLSGGGRQVYAVCATLAEYFNVFVLFAQLFAKVPVLKAIAPTQSSPAFVTTQLVVLIVFIWLGVKAYKGMRA